MRAIRSRILALGIVGMLAVTVLPVGPASASASHSITVTSSSEFGKFKGVDFTRHDCRFAGTADSFAYTRADLTVGPVTFDVFCSIILPDDPRNWNGRLLVEPFDSLVADPPPIGEFNRPLLLTDDLLFGEGGRERWGYASISYFGGVTGDLIDQPLIVGPFGPELPAVSLEILADFAATLRTGGSSTILGFGSSHGEVDAVAATGFSNQATALRGTMRLWPAFGNPFDAALVMASVGHLEMDPSASFVATVSNQPLDFGTQRAIFLNSESEVIANGSYDAFGFVPVASSIPLRTEADDVHRFIYEVAGGAHLDVVNQADLLDLGVVTPGAFDESNPLIWAPVIRAVFVLMDQWLADGASPPLSVTLDPAIGPPGPDPAYAGHPSVLVGLVNRDENLNALGGIRLPDVALGTGRYFGIGPPLDLFGGDVTTSFFQWLAGGFVDLSCQPLADGSDRFKNHGDYVKRFKAAAKSLVSDGFLLPSDAAALGAEAASSDVGKCK